MWQVRWSSGYAGRAGKTRSQLNSAIFILQTHPLGTMSANICRFLCEACSQNATVLSGVFFNQNNMLCFFWSIIKKQPFQLFFQVNLYIASYIKSGL